MGFRLRPSDEKPISNAALIVDNESRTRFSCLSRTEPLKEGERCEAACSRRSKKIEHEGMSRPEVPLR